MTHNNNYFLIIPFIFFSTIKCEISPTSPTTTTTTQTQIINNLTLSEQLKNETELNNITTTTFPIIEENNNNETVTKIPRETENELPNPSEIADPSLLPVHLEKPEYRPLLINNPMPVVTENPKLGGEEETFSTTIMSLGEGDNKKEENNKIIEEIITTTNKPEEITETITNEPKTEETTTEEKAEETTIATTEAQTITTTNLPETTTEQQQQEEDQQDNDNEINEEEIIKLMTEALKRSNLAIQNVTLVLPGDPNPTLLQTFLQTLLSSNRPSLPLFPSNQFWPPAAATIPINIAATIQQQSPPIKPNYLIQIEQLNELINSGKNIKILDASYDPEPLPIDHVKFYSDYYAKWDKLLGEKRNLQYEREHVEGAIPFNLNIATYPSWNERQSLYSPELFQQYIQRLGIDQNDQLIIYGRGPIGGMLQAARVWFLFRIYGHENVGILNGGFDVLKNSDIQITNETTETNLGNWTAQFRDDLLTTFEELTTADNYGYCILSRLYWYNFLDARPRNEFFGLSGLYDMQRGHLSGSKPFPADELVTPQGFLLTPVEILKKLTQIGYNRNYQTIIFGNTADEASLVLFSLALIQDKKAKLYNGGMEEIRRRAPYLISLKQ